MSRKICKIGVIGFGLRGQTVVQNIPQHNLGAKVTCICEVDIEGTKNTVKNMGYDVDNMGFYTDVDEMMKSEELDGVVISTRCNLHTDLAIKVMEYNVPIFLEKPVTINEESLEKLDVANKKFKPEVLVSFPLRVTPLCQRAKQIVDSGVLGDISQVQAVNNVAYGEVYYTTWYKDASITGGLFLQKSTHDMDVINYLINDVPVTIAAMQSGIIFNTDENKSTDENGDDTDFNQDSGTIMFQYSNGVHGVYTQNFVVRNSAAKRMVRIVGRDATIEFDFVTGEIKLVHHKSNVVEIITVNDGGLAHFGGDKALVVNFIDMLNGTEESLANLQKGIDSARICLAAKRSAVTKQFVNIK